MKKVLSILFLASIFSQISYGQISGIINIYSKVIAVDPSCNKVSVGSSAGFAVGDTVLIIQMQGAEIDESNSLSFGDINPITDLNEAGNYEFANIAAVDGNDIYLRHTIRSYNPAGSVQLVSVPQYSDVTIDGTLTAQAWDGNTGGVLVFEASGTVTLNANIDVSALGFRGGNRNVGSGSTCSVSNIYTASNSTVSAGKGEGIASFITNKENGRGKQANGGGGGNSNNTGGGGGSNFGKGGNGGYQAYLRTSSFSGCNLSGNGNPGIGGLALPYSNAANKIFLGGGGGGGHQNNYIAPGPPTWVGGTPGGNGGGIVIINANVINGNSYSILAKGSLSPLSNAWGDGGGGGGGGGTVLLNSSNYSSPITIDVAGGQGDNIYDETSRDLGPGGGGGGGLLWVSTPAVDPAISLLSPGGNWGIMLGVTTGQDNHGAQAGDNGSFLTGLAIVKGSTPFNQTCISLPVELITFRGKLIKEKVKLEWTTSTEKNNDYFTIEKTTDLSNFTTLAKVKGQLNSSSPLSYFAYDENPGDGVTYYRLSQTDIDGSAQVLGIISVKNVPAEKLIHKIYPVPFQNELFIEWNASAFSSPEVSILIHNVLGEKIYEGVHEVSEKTMLPLPSLTPGVYTLFIRSNDRTETVKILK